MKCSHAGLRALRALRVAADTTAATATPPPRHPAAADSSESGFRVGLNLPGGVMGSGTGSGGMRRCAALRAGREPRKKLDTMRGGA